MNLPRRFSHLLVYEPRTEGHHPGWLRFITEDLLSGGYQLTLAVDQREAGQRIIQDHLGPLLKEVAQVPVYDDSGNRRGGTVGSVELCLRESGAESVFLCALDEIASVIERRATFGFFPPALLRGRMGGIYHRPRFTSASPLSPNRWLKQTGFRRLLRNGWLRQVLSVDPYLCKQWRNELPDAPFYFLPDPCPPGYVNDRAAARKAFGVPQDKTVFLFYGVGSRRKGLHLTTEAFLQIPVDSRAFLLCAGRVEPSPTVSSALDSLTTQGRALSINRYVSDAEEKLLFAAADFVLLPYIHHFGTSGVLSRAAAAGKPVIASDEELLGCLVKEYNLGLLFPTEQVSALREQIIKAASAPKSLLSQWTNAAQSYANRFSREAYRAALLNAVACNPTQNE